MTKATDLIEIIDTALDDTANRQASLDDCTHFDKYSGTCRGGCASENVAAGDTCPFIDYQRDCNCYTT
jgi:hypothetical protein